MLSISLVSLVCESALVVSVIGIAETEAGLLADSPYFNLNCYFNVRGSTNTHVDAG